MIKPTVFKSKVIAAQSTRKGGVSTGCFSSLNLGFSVGDLQQHVNRNYEIFCDKLGIKREEISKSHQVHGAEILISSAPGSYEGYDAQITNKKNIYLAVTIADCVPVLVHDEEKNVVAAIHAGWKGSALSITYKTIQAMQREFKSRPKNCKAWIGACISKDAYEVGEDVADNFDLNFRRYDAQKRKWFLDLKEVNKQQLLDGGLLAQNIQLSPDCTVAREDIYFSHRRDQGKSGRMLAIIGMKG